MPLSQRSLSWFFATFWLSFLFISVSYAETPATPLHWSGDKTFWDRKLNVIQLIGNAVVNKPGENLKADTIVLDMNKRLLRARGNCVYMSGGTLIHADEIHFNIDTSAGTVIQGRVTDGSYLLTGQRINRLSHERYQAHKAEYTTCWDCPGSWSFEADDIDIEFEAFAKFTNVMAKVSGTPLLWFPYLIVPIKTKRQSGLLFPIINFQIGGHGIVVVPRFYWASSRSTDMTIGAGTYSERGFRGEIEGRYVLGERSKGTINAFYTQDAKSLTGSQHRFAFTLNQKQEFPFKIEQKANIYYMSDNLYPTNIADVPGAEQPSVASDMIVSKSSSILSGYIAGRIYRNMLYFSSPLPPNLSPFSTTYHSARDFDTRTVQIFPQAELKINDTSLFGSPLVAGFTGGLSHFWRESGHFDFDCEATASCSTFPLGNPVFGTDPIRRAIRYNVTPSLYTTLRPFDVFSLVPSAKFYGYYYDFQSQIPNLFRGYVHLQADLSMQFEKVFDTDYQSFPRVKHMVRPILKYSVIPYRFEDANHPFMKQITTSQNPADGATGKQGYKFDNLDIVPYSVTPSIDSYFTPLGNSLTYGLVTQWQRRASDVGPFQVPTSETFLEFTLGQTVDFTQLSNTIPENYRVPFSRFYFTSRLAVDKVSFDTTYYYYPYVVRLIGPVTSYAPSPHWLNVGAKYTFESATAVLGTVFERSIWARYEFRNLTSRFSNLKMGFTFSLSDYFHPSAWAEYEFWPTDQVLQQYPYGRLQKVETALLFQSPARCWKVGLTLTKDFVSTEHFIHIKFNLDLNWTGSSSGTFTGLPGGSATGTQ